MRKQCVPGSFSLAHALESGNKATTGIECLLHGVFYYIFITWVPPAIEQACNLESPILHLTHCFLVLRTMLYRFFRGRKLAGTDSHVLLPIITAFCLLWS